MLARHKRAVHGAERARPEEVLLLDARTGEYKLQCPTCGVVYLGRQGLYMHARSYKACAEQIKWAWEHMTAEEGPPPFQMVRPSGGALARMHRTWGADTWARLLRTRLAREVREEACAHAGRLREAARAGPGRRSVREQLVCPAGPGGAGQIASEIGENLRQSDVHGPSAARA